MARYRNKLPQLGGGLYLTDGGIETTLIFHEGLELPDFAAFHLAAISFTVETDGNLPTGQTLKAALEQVDEATSAYPCYYMINCAHPTHFDHVLAEDGLWLDRIAGLRANASRRSHAELNESSEFDVGNPVELGGQYARLKQRLSRLNVMGGCCGTDHRHVERPQALDFARRTAAFFGIPVQDRCHEGGAIDAAGVVVDRLGPDEAD